MVLADLRELSREPDALFIEEAQWLPNAGLFIKGLVDEKPDFPIIVTGSSSFYLGDRLRESLAGRASRHVLLPLGLSEVCPLSEETPPAIMQASRRDGLMRLLSIGGYPEVWLSPRPERVLADLLQGLILRDATDLLRVERTDAFVRILRLAAGQAGNILNVSEYSSLCGVSSGTVSKYLSIMQDMHVLSLVPPFAGGKRRELTGSNTVFFVDNGLRNSLLNRFQVADVPSPEFGALVENWVLGELLKATGWPSPVRFWRSQAGAEVDFVLELPDSTLGIEVMGSSMSRPALSRSSRSFIDAYKPSEFWVLSDSLCDDQNLDHTIVRWIPFCRLPEELRGYVVAR